MVLEARLLRPPRGVPVGRREDARRRHSAPGRHAPARGARPLGRRSTFEQRGRAARPATARARVRQRGVHPTRRSVSWPTRRTIWSSPISAGDGPRIARPAPASTSSSTRWSRRPDRPWSSTRAGTRCRNATSFFGTARSNRPTIRLSFATPCCACSAGHRTRTSWFDSGTYRRRKLPTTHRRLQPPAPSGMYTGCPLRPGPR